MKKGLIIITILYTLLISILSTLDVSLIHRYAEVVNADKVSHIEEIVHFCFYFAMNVLLILVVMAITKSSKLNDMLLATGLAVFYGFIIEILQIYVGRGFELIDIGANAAGALLALCLMRQTKVNELARKYLNIE